MFGDPLACERLKGKRASRIRWVQNSGYGTSEDKQAGATAAQADAIVRLAKAIEPFLDKLKAAVG